MVRRSASRAIVTVVVLFVGWLFNVPAERLLLFVGCLTSQQSDCYFCLLLASRASNVLVYLRDRSAQTTVRDATLR